MNEHVAPRALLVSLRDPHDAMAAHERACFALHAEVPVDHIDLHFMVEGPLHLSHATHYDGVFFGGSGAYSVLDDIHWIREGMVALQRVLDARVPSWASCFGFQGLAVALGGEVRRDDDATEMGSTLLDLTPAGVDDPLMGALPAQFWAQEGHHDRVTRIPPGVTELARGTVCPEQAFRVDGAPFWASQFHPELAKKHTIERFHHYRAHYFEGPPAEADAVLAELEAGLETDGVPQLLARLLRGGFRS